MQESSLSNHRCHLIAYSVFSTNIRILGGEKTQIDITRGIFTGMSII